MQRIFVRFNDPGTLFTVDDTFTVEVKTSGVADWLWQAVEDFATNNPTWGVVADRRTVTETIDDAVNQ